MKWELDKILVDNVTEKNKRSIIEMIEKNCNPELSSYFRILIKSKRGVKIILQSGMDNYKFGYVFNI